MADHRLLEFTAGLQPQLVLEGCRFSHIEPWKDPRFSDLVDGPGTDRWPAMADELLKRARGAVRFTRRA